MPISDGMGLVFSVTGYNETIVVSFTGCAEQLPDPEVLAQCLRDSFQDYLALAQRAAKRRSPKATARTSGLAVPAVNSGSPKRVRRAAKGASATA
jgi:hypothetical protein